MDAPCTFGGSTLMKLVGSNSIHLPTTFSYHFHACFQIHLFFLHNLHTLSPCTVVPLSPPPTFKIRKPKTNMEMGLHCPTPEATTKLTLINTKSNVIPYIPLIYCFTNQGYIFLRVILFQPSIR